MADKRKVVPFRKLVPANTPIKYLPYRVQAQATIEEVRVRFYAGQQMALKIDVFITKKGGSPEEVIQYAPNTDKFLAGDDDYFVFPVTIPIEQNDFIYVRYQNDDINYDYHMAVDIVIDEVGGKQTVR